MKFDTPLIELLAPAKDLDCGRAAIDCGADAVYIGAARFGARGQAGNSIEDIAALADYAHRYWTRVYVALNTILRDDEMGDAVALAERVYEAGADGLIIQDVGLLECALPPLPVIASTQMHTMTPERAAFLQAAGFSRAILARELDLGQIAAIHAAAPDLELECFVHGALCVCYSGQCYLSCAQGGRSGNRGDCAQPCRKRYRLLETGQEKHWLSLRDLDLSWHLRALLEAGATAFKIEGRLKDRAYVMNVTAAYRQRLDEAMEGLGLRRASSGRSTLDFDPDLAKTFNRGYTSYFLQGRNDQVGAVDTPKMTGEWIGHVKQFGPQRLVLDRAAPLHAGDGLAWFDTEGQLCGTPVNGVRGHEVEIERTEGLSPGCAIYRNRDHEFLKRINAGRAERRIGVRLTVRAHAGTLYAEGVDEDGIWAQASQRCAVEPATQVDAALDAIMKQMRKSGSTEFRVDSVDVSIAPVPFAPPSVWNALRRGVLEELAQARAEARPVATRRPAVADAPYPETALDYTGNVLNRQAAEFYRRHGVETIAPAAETGVDLRGKKVMTMRYCLRHELGQCPRRDPGVKGGAQPMTLEDESGNRLELRFCCSRCEMEVYWLGPAR